MQAICKAFCEANTVREKDYKDNFNSYKEELIALDEEFRMVKR